MLYKVLKPFYFCSVFYKGGELIDSNDELLKYMFKHLYLIKDIMKKGFIEPYFIEDTEEII